jgi:hypothetical protein
MANWQVLTAKCKGYGKASPAPRNHVIRYTEGIRKFHASPILQFWKGVSDQLYAPVDLSPLKEPKRPQKHASLSW